MWNLCRSAALQQLKRTAVSSQRIALQSSVLRASAVSSLSLSSNSYVRQFATRSSFAGVELSHLLDSSAADLAEELNKSKIQEIQRALRDEFDEVVARPQDEILSDDMLTLFSAAQTTRQHSVMLDAFSYLLEHFPNSIDFVMYGEVYRILSRGRGGPQLSAIYELARPRFEPSVPELVYRFGIVGKIDVGKMDEAEQLVEEMKDNGHVVSNEINSRLIAGYAREKNVEKVLELYEKLDARVGQWHASAIDRVILSLGVAGKADLAFEFYVNSNMKLNGGTLITLLSVCRHNNCIQQASDILANRKRFDLKLDARAYNAILETLEFLDRREDILSILEEMGDEGVRFDTLTKIIVKRNQEFLKGTYFDLQTAFKRSTGNNADYDNGHNNKFVSSAEIKKCLQENKFKEAVALADQLVSPVTVDDLPESTRDDNIALDGMLKVLHPGVAKEVVSGYIGYNQVDKVAALLKGFEVLDNRFSFALMEIMTQYAGDDASRKNTKLTKKQRELAYRAAKLLLAQNWKINRAGPALQVFRDFRDTDASRQLFEQLFTSYKNQDEADEKNKKVSAMVVNRALTQTLRTLSENNKVDDALEVLEMVHDGFRVEPSHYGLLLSSMRTYSAHVAKHKGVVVKAEGYKKMQFYYLSDPFEKVLDAVEKNGVRITRGIVANLCFALAGGERRQRLRLLEAYAAACENAEKTKDEFEMPSVIYTVLMQVCGKETGNVEEMKKIYQDGLKHLPKRKDGEPSIPVDWEVVIISQLADSGHVDEALERLEQMKNVSGMHSYEATIKVLRGCIDVSNFSLAKRTAALLEKRDFKLTLSDCYDLVHLARDHDMAEVAFDVVTQYERAYGRATEDAVGHAKSRQSVRDKFAVRKIRSMYRVVLKLCEEKGEWKRALSFNTRVNELLRFQNAGSLDDDNNDDSGELDTKATKQ